MADYAASAPTRARRYPRADTARAVSFVRRLDWVMLAAVGGLVGFGLWAIDGITRQDIAGDPNYFVTRQAIFAVMGAVGLVGALLVDPSLYRRYYKAIYGLLLGMLLVVTVIGTEVRGSTRWIDLGFFQFQPSEFGKLLLALFLAGLLAAQGKRITESRTTLIAIGAASVPTLFVFLQPDIGTALVYGAILLASLFFAGTRWRDLAILAAVGTVLVAFVLWAGPAMGVDVLEPYQRDRLTAFTDPSKNPRGAAYNINQSITAVGCGRARRARSHGCDADAPRLPPGARDGLRLRRALRAAGVRRGVDPPLPLPAPDVARDPRHRHGARRLRGNACRRDRLRPALPDVREHRDDDRNRSDHGNSTPVRERRRLGDGHESDGDRRPPGDRPPPPLVRPAPVLRCGA